MERKSKKYYRDQIDKGYDFAVKILKEIIKKYGDPIKGTRGKRKASFNSVSNGWNGEINGFFLNGNSLFVEIYWQGDSTDGTSFEPFNYSYIICPQETFFDGYSTREVHSDIRFDKHLIYQAIKNFKTIYLK